MDFRQMIPSIRHAQALYITLYITIYPKVLFIAACANSTPKNVAALAGTARALPKRDYQRWSWTGLTNLHLHGWSHSWEECFQPAPAVELPDCTHDARIAVCGLQPAFDGVDREDRNPHGHTRRTASGHNSR